MRYGMEPVLRVYEVSPRDGLQNEPTVLSTDMKLGLIQRLIDAGCRDIEVSSFVRPRWVPQLADAAELIPRLPKAEGVNYWGLVPNEVGLERAMESGLGCVATVLSASETHNKKNVNRTVRESLASISEVTTTATRSGLRVRAYISTAFGCPYEGAIQPDAVLAIAERLLAAGAEEIALGDTVGMGDPSQIEAMVARFDRAGIGVARLGLHLHDTRGTALANALTGFRCGIRTIDGSVGGMGGCPYAPGASGNAATEDIVNMFGAMGVTTGIDLDRLCEAGAFAESALGHALPGRYHRYALGARQRQQAVRAA